jgi:hypothetical protein
MRVRVRDIHGLGVKRAVADLLGEARRGDGERKEGGEDLFHRGVLPRVDESVHVLCESFYVRILFMIRKGRHEILRGT